MKQPEPLKDKKNRQGYVDVPCGDSVFTEQDILSAVEWLEQEINAIFQISGTEMDEQEKVIIKLREAFQDVIKK